MPCKRCEVLPRLNLDATLVYTYIPTHHHEPYLEAYLKVQKYTYESHLGYLLVDVNDFEKYVNDLSMIFNSLEQADVMLLPLDRQKGLTFDALHEQKSLAAWKSYLIDAKDVVYVIENKKFKILYQPIRYAKTNEIYGYEALIRGIDQDKNLIAPFRLFEQAKRMDLVFQLDKAARETIIDVSAKKGINKQLFINFLPSAIYQPELCLQTTNKAIDKNQIKKHQVTFEVVETERIKDYDHLKNILDFYQKQGYNTALDDVGAGYNTSEVIKQLRPNLIKIDRAIAKDIDNKPTNQKILIDYIKLARSLNIKILVEGIETKAEAEYLNQLDIDYVQGYYFGKPDEDFLE